MCARCKTPLALHGAVSEINGRGLEALAQRSPLPVVVDFWAGWCAPCKMFAPIFSRAAEQLAGEFVFAKLDTEADPAAAQAYQVQSIPTVAIFHRGELKNRFSGAMELPRFVDWIRGSAA